MSKWFVIQSGEHAGLVHMGGWMKTAIQTVDWPVPTDVWPGHLRGYVRWDRVVVAA